MTLGECEICETYLCSCNKRLEMAVKGTEGNKTPKDAKSCCGYSISVTWNGTHTGTISQRIQIKIEKPESNFRWG